MTAWDTRGHEYGFAVSRASRLSGSALGSAEEP
jgi:hypothetical protein